MNKRNIKSQRIKYDKNGRRIRTSKKEGGFGKSFLKFLLPYIIINGLILAALLARPEVKCGEPDTTDYKTASVDVNFSSILPIKDFSASLEGEDVKLIKDKEKGHYTAILDNNGTLSVKVKAINGMQNSIHIPINLLDSTTPKILSESEGFGYVELCITDNQSGIDYSSIYGVDSDGVKVLPSDIDEATGEIMIPMSTDTLTVYISDIAGNQLVQQFPIE